MVHAIAQENRTTQQTNVKYRKQNYLGNAYCLQGIMGLFLTQRQSRFVQTIYNDIDFIV